MYETEKIPEELEVTVVDAPRQKRKYTKRAKMLLRSNNDYIDHTYWPRMYKKAKERDKRMKKEHPERYVKVIPPTVMPIGPTLVRKVTKEQLAQMEIDNCAVYGIKCSKHDTFHTPAEAPKHNPN